MDLTREIDPFDEGSESSFSIAPLGQKTTSIQSSSK
jgi:hypothetical protein